MMPRTGTAQMAMDNCATNRRYETLSEALRILDPEGTLSPGTPEHNQITEEILAWMARMEPGEVLRMSYDRRHLIQHRGFAWIEEWNGNPETMRFSTP
jgi:hypothetical protein